jgi:hypothetical protein
MGKLYFEENAYLCGDVWENRPIGCWRPYGQPLVDIGDPFGKVQRVLKALWEMLTQKWRHFFLKLK